MHPDCLKVRTWFGNPVGSQFLSVDPKAVTEFQGHPTQKRSRLYRPGVVCSKITCRDQHGICHNIKPNEFLASKTEIYWFERKRELSVNAHCLKTIPQNAGSWYSIEHSLPSLLRVMPVHPAATCRGGERRSVHTINNQIKHLFMRQVFYIC